jgi:uncharacterized protein (DUF305 family)
VNSSRRSFILGAAAVTAGAPSAARTHAGGAHEHHPGVPQNPFSTEMHQRMRAIADAMNRISLTGDPDRDFLAMMIPHHQGAIDMASLVLVHGRDPLTRQLAQDIIASQQAEIRSMQGRRATLASPAQGDAERFPALTGARGAGSQ